jgi:hypothetical protein
MQGLNNLVCKRKSGFPMIQPTVTLPRIPAPWFGSTGKELEYQLHAWESEGGSPSPDEFVSIAKPDIYELADPNTQTSVPDAPKLPQSLPEPYQIAEPNPPAKPPVAVQPPAVQAAKPAKTRSRFVQKLKAFGQKLRGFLKKLGI